MLIDQAFDNIQLTGYVRELPLPANYILNQYLPDEEVGDIDYVIRRIERTTRAAEFRAYDAESPIARRDGFSEDRGQLPPISQKILIGEYDRLQLERARTGSGNDQALVDAVYGDAVTLTRNVRARMELARGQVLSTGAFTITDENGLIGLSADFGVPAAQMNVAPAGDTWDVHATAEVLTDLRTWTDAYVDANGEPPGVIVVSRTGMSHALQNAEIRAVVGTVNGVPNIVSPTQLNQVLAAHSLPPLVSYDTRVNFQGATERVIAEDLVILLPTNPRDLGRTVWGTTAEALELTEAGAIEFSDAPGLVGLVMRSEDPPQKWTKVAAIGMPVIENPNLLFVADAF